jgi:hypothetical protein
LTPIGALTVARMGGATAITLPHQSPIWYIENR